MLEKLRKFDLQFFADGDAEGGHDAGSQETGGKTYSQEEAERIAAQREEWVRRQRHRIVRRRRQVDSCVHGR